MKPTAQRKAKRAAGKKREQSRQAKQKVKIKKQALHEQRKKEKAAKGKKRRASFEKQLRIRRNNIGENAKKEPMKTPPSRKYQRSPKEIARENEAIINTLADSQTTAGGNK